ncbi:MAG: DUF2807 domain-containing protein [Bacteroidota bacterium]
MNRLIVLFLLCAMGGLFSVAHAQKNGNGKAETQTRSLTMFTKLAIEFPAEVEVVCQELPHLSITMDENLFQYVEIKNSGGELRIRPTTWIEPKVKVHIKIGTAFLRQLEPSGYGTYWVRNLEGPEFHLKNRVSDVELEGQVKEAYLSTNTGTVDASQLTCETVHAEVNSFGSIHVHATDMLDAKVSDNGKVMYEQEPEIIHKKVESGGEVLLASEVVEEPIVEPGSVSLRLKNNKGRKIDVYVQGPKGRRFSYGMPFKSGQVRKETFPVGTRIFLDNILTRKLLVTISEEHANKTVDLFN